MPPDMKNIILTNMNVKVLQGSVATYLRGGDSFNSSFLRRSFLNLTMKKWKLAHYCWSYRLWK